MSKAILVAGLGFGDEGKGTTVEALVQRHASTLVVRYNGGAQAAHNVVAPDGRHHTFAQFGSGTLLGARTFLSSRMIVDPLAMVREAEHLRLLGVSDPFGLLYVDGDAPVVTPIHRERNIRDEAIRGHGSCGMGIGVVREETLAWPERVLRVRDLVTLREHEIAARLEDLDLRLGTDGEWHSMALAWRLIEAAKMIRNVVDLGWLRREMRGAVTVFEGAQGVLLDQEWGFHPHTTWSDCTFGWAHEMLDQCGIDDVERVGVTRAYHTRHGAGPFPTERATGLDEPHNAGGFAGAFRSGDLDLSLLRYAVDAIRASDRMAEETCGVRRPSEPLDAVALTHLDRQPRWRVCESWGHDGTCIGPDGIRLLREQPYEHERALTHELRSLDPRRFEVASVSGWDLPSVIEDRTGVRVGMLSMGPTVRDKVWQ